MIPSYNIKGLQLNESEICCVHRYYEAAMTAEYIIENYNIESWDRALEKGYEVREYMYANDVSEAEAIAQLV